MNLISSKFWFRLAMLVGLSLELTTFGAMAQTVKASSYGTPHESEADSKAIRPFQVHIPEEELTDLRKRILATRWPDKETVSDQTQGTQLATMNNLAHYWANDYDWRKFEAKLNALPMFVTNIDGEDIHFIHVRSKHENAMPIILMHGWPGSIVEKLKVIEPLTNPTAYGGKASDAFDVVIPSMPGYGFSGKPTTTGWGPDRIARAYGELMNRLGYKKYVAQGGDWGAIIADVMGVQQPSGLIGIHTNLPFVVPSDLEMAIQAGKGCPPGLTGEEKRACAQLDFFYKHAGYALLMGTRPQTLTGLADSPVGLAAFMLDHDAKSLALITKAFNGQPGGLSRDDVLDNITLYWLTNTPISSARLYWENKYPFFGIKGVKLPVAVSVFPDEVYEAPKSWTQKAYPNLIYFNKVDKGGHFATWEQPKLFVDELRNGLRSLR
ncbi:pimeloyl-ACP methyl ester carboxylesterase [Paenibacillus sp. V4I3]|uniref:epoxide hydrolase family protein n=1 Tax=Paenibacillus sp. V4I3 TaxID=3042305 RepID=UPI002786DA5E|nr:epoxide hydrolase family protein [Paenibacillus sp. V4I3]MDQ0875930.1 pimeloyl-ACP methyl ester carboxylesterase [Paenibacillus sp. V4I3]